MHLDILGIVMVGDTASDMLPETGNGTGQPVALYLLVLGGAMRT